MADGNRVAPGKRMDPEQRIEIGEARPELGNVGTTHQFETNRARGSGRTDEEANAAEADEEAQEDNQTRGDSRRAQEPAPMKGTKQSS